MREEKTIDGIYTYIYQCQTRTHTVKRDQPARTGDQAKGAYGPLPSSSLLALLARYHALKVWEGHLGREKRKAYGQPGLETEKGCVKGRVLSFLQEQLSVDLICCIYTMKLRRKTIRCFL